MKLRITPYASLSINFININQTIMVIYNNQRNDLVFIQSLNSLLILGKR